MPKTFGVVADGGVIRGGSTYFLNAIHDEGLWLMTWVGWKYLCCLWLQVGEFAS